MLTTRYVIIDWWKFDFLLEKCKCIKNLNFRKSITRIEYLDCVHLSFGTSNKQSTWANNVIIEYIYPNVFSAKLKFVIKMVHKIIKKQ